MGLGSDIAKNAGEVAADELTNKTVPELLAGLNSSIDRLEKLLDRLDGAVITLTIKLGTPK